MEIDSPETEGRLYNLETFLVQVSQDETAFVERKDGELKILADFAFHRTMDKATRNAYLALKDDPTFSEVEMRGNNVLAKLKEPLGKIDRIGIYITKDM